MNLRLGENLFSPPYTLKKTEITALVHIKKKILMNNFKEMACDAVCDVRLWEYSVLTENRLHLYVNFLIILNCILCYHTRNTRYNYNKQITVGVTNSWLYLL
jgi:hypothetical protein